MQLTHSVLLFLLPSALALQEQQNPVSPTPSNDLPTELSSLLAQADRSALHYALHNSHSSFTDGTHENDIAAVRAVHRESPPLAIQIAQLARRQQQFSNTTSPITSAAATSTTQPTVATSLSDGESLSLTTFTRPDGSLTTATSLVVVGVGATQSAKAGDVGAAATATGSHGSGHLQSAGDRTAVPWLPGLLALDTVLLFALLGYVGAA